MGDATELTFNTASDKVRVSSPPSCKIFFNTDNMVHQKFSFRSSYLDYICKNASASLLLKLYKTCKFFYSDRRLNIIEDFEICECENEQRIVGNSLAICLDNPAWSKLGNFWISNSFTYGFGSRELDHKKFSCMTYKSLSITGKLSVTDFEFLIKPTTIRHLFAYDDIYYPETDLYLSTEEMIERAPHVSAFVLLLIHSPPLDMAKLIALERQTTLQSLHLEGVSKIPNALHFFEFFKKHATPDVDYYFDFDKEDDEYDPDNVKTFYKTINAELRAWKTSLQRPPPISSSFIDLTGKLAVITACDGIGIATAILFRQLGASVVVFSRNSIELKSLVEECQSIKNDGSLRTLYVYALSSQYFENCFNYILGSKIDILINYCDIFGVGGVPDNKFEEKMRTKSFVIFRHCVLADCAKPYLIEAKGTMINVTHPHDLIFDPKEAESVANWEREIKNHEAQLLDAGVRINNVNSGAHVTALPRPPGMSDFDFKKLLEKTQKDQELQIANILAFLSFDSA